MSNIILIGFMGSGKTSVGSQLAKKLAFQFKDTDRIIEDNCGRSIKSIFAREGEGFFRELETKTVKDLIDKAENHVISVGGGLPVQPGNGELLRQLGHVIYLKTSRDTIIKRLSGDTTRPLLSGDNPKEKVESMLKLREPLYEAAAHLTVITDDRKIGDIIEEIIRRTGVIQ